MHPALQTVADATAGTPFAGRIWLVGGAVRDELLGRQDPRADFDLVTEFPAEEMAWAIHRAGLSERPEIYARFGTAMVIVQGVRFELATARRESYAEESRKPHVEPATLLEDARRRDFTTNAILRNLHSGELADPLGNGLDDLRARILRTPLEPEATFRDDPLRMLRAVRFRQQLSFQFAPGLAEAICVQAGRLEIVSRERIRDEFARMLVQPNPDEAMRDLMELGLLSQFAPELEPMRGVEQGRYHHLDVWDHTLLVLRNAGTDDLALALACLLHDVGKPATRTVDENGDTRFFGHENLGAALSRELLLRLRFGVSLADQVALLVKNHMRLGTAREWTDAASRRLVRDLDNQLDRLLALVEADASALRPGVRVMDVEAIRRRIEAARVATPPERLASPLSGEEIMRELDWDAGPRVGEAKAWLAEQVIEGALRPGDRRAARQALRERYRPLP